MKVLLAIDGSPCSDRAVKEILRRPWPECSTIKVLNAFELPLPTTPEGWVLPATYFDQLDQAVQKQSQFIVDRAVETLRRKFTKTMTIEGQFVPGSARSAILEEAERWGADLIVVGSHGYSTWERFLLGSVSQAIVSHAKCSVEIVRCSQAVPTSKEAVSAEGK